MNINDLRIYAITDRSWLKPGEMLSQKVEEAILGGATIVQLREKEKTGNELKELALLIKGICNQYKVPFIVNDDVELAKAIDADGVHVGLSDMAIEKAREIMGADKIVGATAKTVEQAMQAEEKGADYIGSGAVFGTTTKKDAKPMSLSLLDEIIASVNIPVVAIGGIQRENIGKLKGHKIAGAAIVSGIFAADNVRRQTQELFNQLYGRKIIQCITNHVTVNEVANVILAMGGSPIMAHHIDEVCEVQEHASGLLLNLGATDDYQAMIKTYEVAVSKHHPIVIDPVGVGSISFRRNFLKRLLEIGTPTCIRGNYGELKAIYEDTNTMNGLDCEELSEEQLVMDLAKKIGCIIVASGAVDIITDGTETIKVESGSSMQKKITGSGCMLSAAICTGLTFAATINIKSVAWVCQYMGDQASQAAKETKGNMSFLNRWIDLISME